jgi:ERCC4-type nuclease
MNLDVRERELIRLFPSVPTRQCPVGDIWIGLSGEEIAPGGLCIERKEVRDLEASLKDNRYREQRTRLLSYCQQTGAKPLYIIEGDLDSLVLKTPKKTLQKVLARLALRYGIPFFQTSDMEDTAKLLQALQEQYQEDPTMFQTPASSVSYTELVSTSRKANRDANLATAMLQQCTGVSPALATALLAEFQGLPRLIQATEKEIANVKVTDKRRVGPAIAKKLWTVFHEN